MQVKNEFLKGIKWKFSQNLVSQLLRVVILLILFRLIEPQVFGTVTLLLVIIMFSANLIDLGFSSALIQKEQVEKEDQSSIFWLHIMLGIIMSVILYFVDFSFLIPAFEEDRKIFRILIFTLIIIPLSFVPSSILTKTLQFKKQAIIEIISILSSGVIALIFAFMDADILALTMQHLSKIFIATILIYYFTKWSPSLNFSIQRLLKYLKLSLSIYTNSIFYYVAAQLDNLLIGSYLGKFDLGIYEKPYNIINIPANQVTRVITRVAFPVLSRVQHDKIEISRIYLKMIHAVGLLVFPASIMLYIFCKPFVLLIFGNNWIDAIPLVRIFSITSYFVAINALFGAILLASGSSRIILVDGFLKKSIIIIAILFTFRTSIEAVALGILAAEIIGIFITFYHTNKLYQLHFTRQLQSLLSPWKTILSISLLILAFYLTGQYFEKFEMHSFVACCLTVPIVYLTILRKYEKEFFNLGLELISRKSNNVKT